MLARTLSVALVGVAAHVVEVEVDVANGLPGFTLTALSDRVLKQVEHRVRSALHNSGETWPNRRTTVALSPAMVPKSGSAFDVAIACGLLAAAEALPAEPIRDLVVLGELTLAGEVRAVAGVLPSVIGAYRQGCRRFVVPRANLREARLVPDAVVTGVASLRELCARLRGEPWDEPDEPDEPDRAPVPDSVPDLADVVGQVRGRRAVEVAAAGAHHVLLVGSPGVGKTMLAERLPGILPDLSGDEALEVTGIHSVAGRLRPGRPLITRPPFCAPHHSSSVPAIVGGGPHIASPGAASLAHRGVLFLDEATEFATGVLDALRQPLESGEVVLARSGGVVRYPARFQLVLAANPCPCSAGGRDIEKQGCICSSQQKMRFNRRLSGPLRDRLDVMVELESVTRDVLVAGVAGQSTQTVRARVEAARQRARDRLAGTPWLTTSDVPGPVLRRRWPVPRQVLRPIHLSVDRGTLSTRGIDRVLKVAWTLADLDGVDVPGPDQVLEALDLRHGTATPRTATPRTATPRTATPPTATPPAATPPAATPPTATPSTVTPRTATPWLDEVPA